MPPLAACAVALHQQDWMDDELDVEAEAGQRSGHAIHKEWHIIIDDLQERAAANPCLLGCGWRKDADLRPAGLTFGGEAPNRERCLREIGRGASDHIRGCTCW